MRDVEGVVAHHRGQLHGLGDAEGLQHGVQRFLRALAVELEPAGVALGQAVVSSGQKAQGEATVRLTLHITIGARAPLA
jgi:hypothetical protein